MGLLRGALVSVLVPAGGLVLLPLAFAVSMLLLMNFVDDVVVSCVGSARITPALDGPLFEGCCFLSSVLFLHCSTALTPGSRK